MRRGTDRRVDASLSARDDEAGDRISLSVERRKIVGPRYHFHFAFYATNLLLLFVLVYIYIYIFFVSVY